MTLGEKGEISKSFLPQTLGNHPIELKFLEITN